MAEDEQDKKDSEDTSSDVKDSAEESVTQESTLKLNVDTSGYDVAIEKAEKLLELKQKLKEADEEPAPEEKAEEPEEKAEEKMVVKKEKVDNTKGKVAKTSENSEEVKTEYRMEASEIGEGMSLYKLPDAEGRVI